jgi:hypothetical protein
LDVVDPVEAILVIIKRMRDFHLSAEIPELIERDVDVEGKGVTASDAPSPRVDVGGDTGGFAHNVPETVHVEGLEVRQVADLEPRAHDRRATALTVQRPKAGRLRRRARVQQVQRCAQPIAALIGIAAEEVPPCRPKSEGEHQVVTTPPAQRPGAHHDQGRR